MGSDGYNSTIMSQTQTRSLVTLLFLLSAFVVLVLAMRPGQQVQSASRSQEVNTVSAPAPGDNSAVPAGSKRRDDAEWRKLLTPEQYRITRQHGTERAFTGEYWDSDADGVYVCVACGTPLFDSSSKFQSACGWPAYSKPLNEANVGSTTDTSFFMVRTEVHCNACDAHLGHVFDDGPPPTGIRYCINSGSVKFIPREALPANNTETPPTK